MCRRTFLHAEHAKRVRAGGAYGVHELIWLPGAGQAELEKVGRKRGSPFAGFGRIRVAKSEKRKRPAGLRAVECGRFFFAEDAKFTCAALDSCAWHVIGKIRAA